MKDRPTSLLCVQPCGQLSLGTGGQLAWRNRWLLGTLKAGFTAGQRGPPPCVSCPTLSPQVRHVQAIPSRRQARYHRGFGASASAGPALCLDFSKKPPPQLHPDLRIVQVIASGVLSRVGSAEKAGSCCGGAGVTHTLGCGCCSPPPRGRWRPSHTGALGPGTLSLLPLGSVVPAFLSLFLHSHTSG